MKKEKEIRKSEISTLSVLDRMIKSDNQEVAMSNTIVSVERVEAGSIIGFGVEGKFGDAARMILENEECDYMIFCMAAKIDEVARARKAMENNTCIVTDNSKVNAKLLESNRELLEVLEDWVFNIENWTNSNVKQKQLVFDRAKQIIKKAKG